MTINEQLIEYCDCLISDESESEPKFTEKDVDELIHLVSSFTCWEQSPCETFLKSDRKEVVGVKDCNCECDVFEFEPFYEPFEADSFVFTLIEQNGIEETYIPIDSYSYSVADEKFRLELPLPDCKCSCRPQCGCKTTYKLMVEYVAGYDVIPECLLPLFCEALKWIIEKNECCCEKCQDCDNKYADVHEIDYTELNGQLKGYFLQVLTHQYVKQLGLISLCGRKRFDLWSVVV